MRSFFWRWWWRLPSPFSSEDFEAGYTYELAFRQFEVSDTCVFDRPQAGRMWFEGVIRDHLDIGRPEQPASIFAETELARLASFPEEIPGDDLIRAFTLTGADRDLVAIRRGAANRLGLALQLCALRYLGFVPRHLSAAPRSAACFVADQLEVSPDEIQSYARREQRRGRCENYRPNPWLRLRTRPWIRLSILPSTRPPCGPPQCERDLIAPLQPSVDQSIADFGSLP